MNALFADTLRNVRIERGFSQRELAELMYVTQPTVARWENGSRLPDAAMISRLAECLGVDVHTLLNAAAEGGDSPNIIMVEDNKPILNYSLKILEEVVPNAMIVGFNKPKMAVEYAKANRIDLVILDIELGTASGLDLCRSLLEINPCTSVVYLTAYPDYSLDAWDTGACGFMVKPLTSESVRRQLKMLRFPFSMGGSDA